MNGQVALCSLSGDIWRDSAYLTWRLRAQRNIGVAESDFACSR